MAKSPHLAKGEDMQRGEQASNVNLLDCAVQLGFMKNISSQQRLQYFCCPNSDRIRYHPPSANSQSPLRSRVDFHRSMNLRRIVQPLFTPVRRSIDGLPLFVFPRKSLFGRTTTHADTILSLGNRYAHTRIAAISTGLDTGSRCGPFYHRGALDRRCPVL